MKKEFLLTCAILFLALASLAQPQWKFHIALEDATGAKDTIWLIWDTTATFGIDTLFNEQAQSINYSVFNAFIGNVNADTTKTQALPHPYASNDVIIYAINYQYPITISWDSSLFNAPGLPLPVGYVNSARIDNNYFFLVNNCPPCQYFNMLIDNHAYAPSFVWGSQSQFPLFIHIERDPSIGINEHKSTNNQINFFPNPSNEYINIQSNLVFKSFAIVSNDGKLIKSGAMQPSLNKTYSIPLNKLQSGFYNLILTNTKNQTYHEKIIIAH